MSALPPFYPAGAAVPAGLETTRLRLAPLTPAHTALDYAALRESRAQLRLWSGSAWPQDDFTLADNRQDMAWHAREHRERIAFTYTVLDPAGTRCLGCVYVKSLARMVAEETKNGELLAKVGDFEAAVRFWVTTPLLAGEADRQLLAALQGWFAEEWPFERLFFHARDVHERQQTLFREAGLRQAYTLMMPGRGGGHLLWED